MVLFVAAGTIGARHAEGFVDVLGRRIVMQILVGLVNGEAVSDNLLEFQFGRVGSRRANRAGLPILVADVLCNRSLPKVWVRRARIPGGIGINLVGSNARYRRVDRLDRR